MARSRVDQAGWLGIACRLNQEFRVWRRVFLKVCVVEISPIRQLVDANLYPAMR
jgi:hypothetical protein